jgi:DNA-binding NarL/FixJ family response regulator
MKAHLRLMAILPVRTIRAKVRREVSRPEAYDGVAGYRRPEDTVRLHAEIRQLHAQGKSRKEIAKLCSVSTETVRRHLNGLTKPAK